MSAQILTFPSRSKPRPVLTVPTTNRIVMLWAELNCRIAAAWMNPCDHNVKAMADARARYVAALVDEQEPA